MISCAQQQLLLLRYANPLISYIPRRWHLISRKPPTPSLVTASRAARFDTRIILYDYIILYFYFFIIRFYNQLLVNSIYLFFFFVHDDNADMLIRPGKRWICLSFTYKLKLIFSSIEFNNWVIFHKCGVECHTFQTYYIFLFECWLKKYGTHLFSHTCDVIKICSMHVNRWL